MTPQELGNQPAYPIRDMNEHPGPFGLTKREAFAMAAMQGMLANASIKKLNSSDAAKAARISADALLASLSKEPHE